MSLMDQGRAMDTLLNAIAEGHSLKESAQKAGVSQGAHYHWLQSDHAYQQGYEFAIRIRGDRAEAELERRAIDGYDEVTTFTEVDEYGEEKVTSRKTVRKYDGGLLLAYVKAAKPEKYTDRIKQEVTGEITVADTLAAARKRLQTARGESDGE